MRIITAAAALGLGLLGCTTTTAAPHASLRRRQEQQSQFASPSSFSGLNRAPLAASVLTPRVAGELLQYAFLYEMDAAASVAAVADDGQVGGFVGGSVGASIRLEVLWKLGSERSVGWVDGCIN